MPETYNRYLVDDTQAYRLAVPQAVEAERSANEANTNFIRNPNSKLTLNLFVCTPT